MRQHRIAVRWAVPAGVVATVGVIIAASAVASAEATPSLPATSAAQLLASLSQAKPLGPLTATVAETADLGLPQLPALPGADGESSASPLTSGTRQVSIWYRDAQHVRVAEPVSDGETDYRLDGQTLWIWNSGTQTATKVTLPAHSRLSGGNGVRPAPGPKSLPARQLPGSPLAAANQVLKAVGPTTVVSVQRNVYVAGRAAYQLELVPRSSQSLVGRVLIAIDASKRIPLRVQVFARGSDTVAYGVGFTALSFGTPAASNFSFAPPPGATVKTQTVPANPKALLPAGVGLGALNGLSRSVGPIKPIALPAKQLAKIKAQFAKHLPKNLSAAQRAKRIKAFDAVASSAAKKGWTGTGPLRPADVTSSGTFSPPGGAKTIGTSWLTVVATPPNPAVAAAIKSLLSNSGGPHAVQSGQTAVLQSSSSSAAYSSTLAVTFNGPAGQGLDIVRALLLASTPVHGSWGSGRLLQTKLLSVLVTSDGRILAGAVTPAQLYQDVPKDAS